MLRARLPHWGLLRASGTQAESFLQAQCTQEVRGLPPLTPRAFGYCLPNGRLLFNGWIWREEKSKEEGADAPFWRLMISRDCCAAALKRLTMFILRAKVALSEEPDAVLVGCLPSEATSDQTPLPLPAIAAQRRALQVLAPHAAADAAPEDAATFAHWRNLEMQSCFARISAAVSGQFIPQMIGFDALGVSFDKGCYPGQEVVARARYRGEVKRHLIVLRSAEPLRAGDEIFSAEEPSQPCGIIIDAADALAQACIQSSATNAPLTAQHAGQPVALERTA